MTLRGLNGEVNKKKELWGRKTGGEKGSLRPLTLTTTPIFLFQLALFFAFPSASFPSDWPHLGPLYDQFPLTLAEGNRREWLGPLFHYEKSGEGSLFTFSPVFSLYRNPSLPQTEAELGYPILSLDKFGSEYRLQLVQLFSWSGGESIESGLKKNRTTLFPIYFRQRSENPADNYTAVLPFYGRLKERLYRDEIYFVMLPIYLQSNKKGMITDNYLFPFFHKRHGAGVRGWQFWPVVGAEHKEITTKTNTWGETEVVGGHEKFFVLWPFYFNNTAGIGTTNEQKQFVLIPFYGSVVSTSRVSKIYGFPLGYTHTIDREKKYEEWDAPWPLVEFARGEGKHANRVWPFFSRARTPTHQSDFFAWPVYKYNRVSSEPLDRERTRVLLFLYSDLIERNTTNHTALRRRDFWPLFTWRKDHQNNERFQMLSLLEPFLPNNKSIERVYSPVYSLWRSEKNAATGDRSVSLLWNFYRSEHRREAARHRALFGLIQREKTAERTQWRVFFIPFTTRDAKSRPETEPR